MTRLQTSLLSLGLLTLSGFLAACQLGGARQESAAIAESAATSTAIETMAPVGVNINAITFVDAGVRITGTVSNASQVAAFMRAIDASGLGNPELNSLVNAQPGSVIAGDNQAEFQVLIRPR